jgi:hypothetical protein
MAIPILDWMLECTACGTPAGAEQFIHQQTARNPQNEVGTVAGVGPNDTHAGHIERHIANLIARAESRKALKAIERPCAMPEKAMELVPLV